MLYFRAALSVAIAYSTGALITLLCLGSIPLFARLPSRLRLGLAASAPLCLRQARATRLFILGVGHVRWQLEDTEVPTTGEVRKGEAVWL